MTRFQVSLLLLLIALASLLVGRVVWETVTLPLLGALSAVPALAASAVRGAPDWVWWTAFSAVWWLPCVIGKRWMWSCGRSSCTT